MAKINLFSAKKSSHWVTLIKFHPGKRKSKDVNIRWPLGNSDPENPDTRVFGKFLGQLWHSFPLGTPYHDRITKGKLRQIRIQTGGVAEVGRASQFFNSSALKDEISRV